MAKTKTLNIFRQEFEEGVEIPLPHRPVLDDDGNEVVDNDGYIEHHTVRVRSLDAGFIFKSGRVPSSLMNAAQRLTIGLGVKAESEPQNGKPETDALSDVEAAEKFIEFQAFVIKEMLVSPRIVDTPKADDEISYDMLSTDDKVFLFNLLERPLFDVRRFRRRPDKGVESVSEGENDTATTE